MLDSGYRAVVSFELEPDFALANEFTKRLRIITIVHSLGGVQSTLSHPVSSSHRLLSAEELRTASLHPGFLRLSVGLEDPTDLIEDLGRGLGSAS